MNGFKLSIDIGGTFVDIVIFDFATRTLTSFKLPTTPDDPAQGVLDAVDQLQVPTADIVAFVHGTTLGLNAILERKGTTVGIVTNAGFRDIFEIGRGSLEFADMYRFDYAKPKQLVERRHIRGVEGRIDYTGNDVAPLDTAALLQAGRELRDTGCKAIAISFLHAYANDSHEREAVALLKEALPDLEISSGAMIASEYREYERTSTAVLDAYIKPVLKNYLGRVGGGMEAAGFSGDKYVMNSSGGALTFDLAEAQPISTVLSGPAGGVSGALYVAEATGRGNLLSVDVGGTSLDACLIVDGKPVDVFEARIDTFPVLQPIFDLRTLGAGGGSIASVDGKLLKVGPESAGAVPGPACYGRGGTDATVTDAALALGYLDATNFMGGEMELARELATSALETNISARLGISVEEAAAAVFDVLISRTASSIREMMLERGLDPRDFAMLSFGGCGPLFGPMLFRELEMAELVVPPLPSVFSAWGMMASDLSFSESASVMTQVTDATIQNIGAIATGLKERSIANLAATMGETAAPQTAFTARLRFIGQEHTLSVPYEVSDTADDLLARFKAAHEERYGHTFDSSAEVVSLMVKLILSSPKPDVSRRIVAPLEGPAETSHDMYDPIAGGFVSCQKLRRDRLEPGHMYSGPLLVSDEGSSLIVQGDQVLHVDPFGMMSLARKDAQP